MNEIKFTTKEMFASIDNKLDKIDSRLDAGQGKIAENRERSKSNQKIIYGVFITLILGIGFEVLRFVLNRGG